MSYDCGKAVGQLWKALPALSRVGRPNRFGIPPQLIPDFSTDSHLFSTSQTRTFSTFPQDLLLQLYILTNPYYLVGEFRGSQL